MGRVSVFRTSCVLAAVSLLVLGGCEGPMLTELKEKLAEEEQASLETVKTPTFSPSSGSYTSDQSVIISCATLGATIYYTTNGSTPSSSSSVYSGAISVAGDGTTKTIKAYAVNEGMNDSEVASASYIISYPAATAEFVGTWVFNDSVDYASFTFTQASLVYSETISGSGSGSISMTIVDYDESLNHILLTVTASSGTRSSVTAGTTVYLIYSIIGTEFQYDWSSVDYPASVAWGGYYKQ